MEVMGRHAGWIAAAGALAADENHDVPLVILFPEVEFNSPKFLAAVDEKVKQYGYCCVVVSEGVKNSDGQFLAEAGGKDAFGHAQLGGAAPVIANLIKENLGYKYHWAVADYLQRAARHIAAKNDVEQAYAVGKAAIEFALAGKNSVMPTIVRTSDAPYQWEIGSVDLKDVANVEKMLPSEFISADGFGITAACRAYLQPLIEGEDYPPYKNGLPDYVVLKKCLVAKKLPEFAI
jgi:6-phosphofructokinase 1